MNGPLIVSPDMLERLDVHAEIEKVRAKLAADDASKLQQHAYHIVKDGGYRYPKVEAESKLSEELRKLKTEGVKVLSFERDGRGNFVIKTMKEKESEAT